MLFFEGKRIDVGANKLKLRRFEIRAFSDKMRSFCTISASTFWKIQPEDGNETLIFKRFRLFWSRFDSSDCESPSKCFLLSNFDIPAYQLDGNETLIFKRFRLFWSRFDSSDCESPSKCFLLSNFDIPAYHLAGFSKRLSTVTNPVSREPPPPPLPILPVPSSYKNGNCLNIRTSLDNLDNIHPRKQPLACVVFD